MKETKEQKEERRYLAELNNPKKDWWARRNVSCKWFRGKCLSIADLIKARKQPAIVKKEMTYRLKEERLKWWKRFYHWFLRVFKKVTRILLKQ